MSAPVETATTPNASTALDASVLDVAHRLLSISDELAKTTALHHSDQADRIGELLSQLNLEYMRMTSVRERAYELAEVAAE